MDQRTEYVPSTASLTITQDRYYPLVVVGGGLAGVCATIAAARQGIPVALIQERPVLGGNSSSEIRVHPVGASQHGYHRDARETGIVEEIFLEVRARSYGLRQVNGQHYPMWDVLLAEKVEAEPNVTLLLNTRVVGIETRPDATDGYETRITGLVASQQGTEQTFRLHCDMAIDATGDGFVALQAGAPFRYGREARDDFHEKWAPEDADDVVLGSTIMFAARDVGRPVPFIPPAWAHSFLDEESLPFRNHTQFDSGYWWIEWGGRLNTITDNDTIRKELHAAVFGVWDHIKNHCTVPGVRERAANWALDWIGHIPGKRESRRFEGDRILTEGDLLAGLNAVPDDVVAYGGWAIDLHAPDGVYSPDRPCTQPPLPGLYGIPLRSLYSRTVSNLFLAGRDISQTHVAHGSTRVMKTCAVIGQASGTAAAIALQRAQTPRALANDVAGVTDVQQTLLRHGAYLPMRQNQDPRDLAQRPETIVTASSSAVLRLDSEAGWETIGLSTSERDGLIAEGRSNQEQIVMLDTPIGQSVVLSEDHLERISLRLQSTATAPVPAHLHVRQSAHVRDFGLLEDMRAEIATLHAIVPPGESVVTFQAPRPIAVSPNRPVTFLLETRSEVGWHVRDQEPPGTQAGRWDLELGYWRWMHGTLDVAISPESCPYGPENVISGVTRPERQANIWISDPAQPLPQWVELRWPTPITVGLIEVTFDSQLSGWIWEGHFPLVVRDYDIEMARANGTWRSVDEVRGNYQRRRVHRFTPCQTDRVRIRINATNGGTTARIAEIRVYPP